MKPCLFVLPVPPGFCFPHIDVRECAVYSDAALVRHQPFSVCSYISRRDSAHLDVGGSPVQMLGICSTANGGISFWSPVRRCDRHRLSEVCANLLQNPDELVCNKYWIRAVGARKLSYFKI